MILIESKHIPLARTRRNWTDGEMARIREYYETTAPEAFDLEALATELDRHRGTVCKAARKMGLTKFGRHFETAKWHDNMVAGVQGKWSRAPHPRGALGMRHTDENKALFSELSRQRWVSDKATGTGMMSQERLQRVSDMTSIRMATADPRSIYSRAAAGVRPDLGSIYFRSAWEANYARYLNWLLARGEIEEWQYEPETFWFEKIRRGVRSYKPDFRILERGKIHYDEIKGYMDPKSVTKMKRMKLYFPEIDLRLIDAKAYRAIAATMAPMLPNWEIGVGAKTNTAEWEAEMRRKFGVE